MQTQLNRRLTGVIGATALAVSLAVVPAVGAQAQGIVYRTDCGVQYTRFSNHGTVENGGLLASTRRASTGCGGQIFVTARSAGNMTYLGTTYSSTYYVSQRTNSTYTAPGAMHGSPAGSFAS